MTRPRDGLAVEHAGDRFLQAGIRVSSAGMLSVILNLAGTMILSRAFGRGGMGQFDLLKQASVMAMTCLSLGVGNASIYLLRSDGFSREEIATAITRYLSAFGFVLIAGMGTAILLLPGYFGPLPIWISAYYGIGTGSLLVVTTLRAFQVARFASRRIAAADVLPPLVMLIGIVPLWKFNQLTLERALAFQASGNIITAILLLAWTLPYIRLKSRLAPALIPRLLKLGVQLYATNLIQVVTPTLTLIVFRAVMPGTEGFQPIGLFTRANALCGLGLLLPTLIGPLLYARWSGLDSNRRREDVELAGRICAFYGMLVALLLVLFGRLALRILYGVPFEAAQAAVYVLAPGVVLFALSSVFLNLFASLGRAWLNAVIFTGATIVTVGAAVMMVPAHGIVGAALATFLGQAFVFFLAAYVGWRLQRISLLRCLWPTREDLLIFKSQFRRSPGGRP